jgi:hypothetical protein
VASAAEESGRQKEHFSEDRTKVRVAREGEEKMREYTRGATGLAIVTALVVGCAGWANPATHTDSVTQEQKQEAEPTGNLEKGKQLYWQYGCYECHGTEGQGGSAGPRLAPRPIPFSAFVRYVRNPRPYASQYSVSMPVYSEKLLKSEQDLADIYLFLHARPAPAPASVLPPE